MRKLFNILLFVLISALELQADYNDNKAPNCFLPYHKAKACPGYTPRYYYSPEDDRCVFYMYGSCGNNANSFMSKEQCKQECDADAKEIYVNMDPSRCITKYEELENCNIARLTRYPVYYYDEVQNKCVAGTYGSCRNKFDSRGQCEEVCVKGTKRTYLTPNEMNPLRLWISKP